ncbi:MAG TPA: hypothetical protein DC042_05930 [Bacteroidales bacterium]|nr:hypothetical protein [Bacteroidales bacterium]
MKETQDKQWIDKIKELLENYTPADPPVDWKQVQHELNRTLPRAARWLLWLRKPWVYGILFSAALITGAICLYPDVMPGAKEGYEVTGFGGREEEERIKSKDQRKSKEEKDRKEEQEVSAETSSPALVTRFEEISNPPSSALVIPAKAGIAPPYHPTDSAALVIPAKAGTAPPYHPAASAALVIPAKAGTAAPYHPADPATKKPRLDLRSIRLPGDPWKVGLGYEYLPIIQPDTGRGSYRGFNIRFSKEVSEQLWVGTGLILGRIDLIDVSKNWVRDWSKTDSLGTIYLRDSTTSEHRWQKHAAIPLTITWDLFRNRNFAIPLSTGSTLGWVYSLRHFEVYENSGKGGGGSPSEFTYFISADLSLGYEVFYRYGLSAILSAEYHRILTGRRSYGFGQNFIGARILINLDFSEKKWR